MAPQPIHILPRAGGGSSSTPLYIAGFVIAGVFLIAGVGWLTIRFLRKRAQRNGEDNRGAAFLNVRGLVREDGEKNGEGALPKYGLQSRVRFCLSTEFLPIFFKFPIIVISRVSRAICSREHT